MTKKLIPTGMGANRSAADYAQRFANELNFAPLQVKAAKTIAERSIELEILTGKSPLSIASAAVWIVGQILNCEKTLAEISEASTMKDITIKNCVKAMCIRLNELIRGFEANVDQKKMNMLTKHQEFEK
eukprot:CAMPEP_0202948416 /NCGR_PEP_ID=MMETSP1395-20130829/13334_1 /ASSEMBLY_ACC=CAM_ASM_000871 /TAXON_ID=5961 /ORGANISM="Blepharisma japonicum, Strain Stock R1072" /LENGTH=128 /DNA_ID=CAMNT_0049650457 /DNA_START=540 /DNA_END=926 /DNA_ORIENTATION=-